MRDLSILLINPLSSKKRSRLIWKLILTDLNRFKHWYRRRYKSRFRLDRCLYKSAECRRTERTHKKCPPALRQWHFLHFYSQNKVTACMEYGVRGACACYRETRRKSQIVDKSSGSGNYAVSSSGDGASAVGWGWAVWAANTTNTRSAEILASTLENKRTYSDYTNLTSTRV